MKIRIEFSENRSPYLKRMIQIFKRFPSYKFEEEGGIKLHSIELVDDECKSFQAIHNMIWTWKDAIMYMNGQLLEKDQIAAMVRQYFWDKEQETKRVRIVDQAVKNAADRIRVKKLKPDHGRAGMKIEFDDSVDE